MGAALLFITTFIWGTAFLAQKFGAGELGPFAMVALRNLLGGTFLATILLFRLLFKNERLRSQESEGRGRPVFRGGRLQELLGRNRGALLFGALAGVPLFFAMFAQQQGIEYTSPGISAFLTTNYIFFVPIAEFLLFRKRHPAFVWLGVLLAILGTYLICLPTGTGTSVPASGTEVPAPFIGPGEAWTILCAILFAAQMMVIDRTIKGCDVLVFSTVQIFTCGLLAVPFMFLPSEANKLAAANWQTAALAIIYCGVFSSGIAYTLQVAAQKRTPVAVAGIIMSMESVFGALSGYLILHDHMTTGQFFGCTLVFIAALGTQLFNSRTSKSPKVSKDPKNPK